MILVYLFVFALSSFQYQRIALWVALFFTSRSRKFKASLICFELGFSGTNINPREVREIGEWGVITECFIITLNDKYWRGQAYNAAREQDNKTKLSDCFDGILRYDIRLMRILRRSLIGSRKLTLAHSLCRIRNTNVFTILVSVICHRAKWVIWQCCT